MKTHNCEKHGGFEEREITMGAMVITMVKCPDCTKESKRKLEEQELHKEFERKKQAKASKRLTAGISRRNLYKSFADLIAATRSQKKVLATCMQFVDEFPESKNIIMLGKVGTGKTLLASSIIESLIEKHQCKIIKLIDMIRELKATFSKDSEATEIKIIKHYSEIPLLIIDEVGTQFGSDTEKLLMFDIIDGRYQEMKPTILISNLNIDGVKELIGERCVDRLREGGGSMIAFDWESERK